MARVPDDGQFHPLVFLVVVEDLLEDRGQLCERRVLNQVALQQLGLYLDVLHVVQRRTVEVTSARQGAVGSVSGVHVSVGVLFVIATLVEEFRLGPVGVLVGGDGVLDIVALRGHVSLALEDAAEGFLVVL